MRDPHLPDKPQDTRAHLPAGQPHGLVVEGDGVAPNTAGILQQEGQPLLVWHPIGIEVHDVLLVAWRGRGELDPDSIQLGAFRPSANKGTVPTPNKARD